MGDTLDAFDIGATWNDLNTLTGIAAGTEILLQCVGSPNDIVVVATNAAEPDADFVGVRCTQNDPMIKVDAGEATVWVRYMRTDKSDIGSKTTKLQVQAS